MLAPVVNMGLDALVLTVGVGENAAIVRSRAYKGFECWGLKLDYPLNEARLVEQDIATPVQWYAYW